MSKNLFLGDEAIAQAALDAGLAGVYAYPGTPSTEITEYIQNSPQAKQNNIHCRWSTNEKTAMEAALGMSYAGKRALCCMKHVGLNVAADCFMNTAISGINGGLIIVTADDPSMHSSQNEQDNRIYGDFAMLPMLEPTDQQEAYNMIYHGFDLSEQLGYPILLRITTRMAHSRAGVQRQPTIQQKPISFPTDKSRFILLPVNARRRFKDLLNAQHTFTQASETSPYNHYYPTTHNTTTAIITTGIAFNYLRENYPDTFDRPVLKISQYPLPRKQVEQIAQASEILILEEGYPYVEQQLKGFLHRGITIHGRLDGTLPRDGELNPDIIAQALGHTPAPTPPPSQIILPRPPALCTGCGHRDLYDALNEVLKDYGNNAKVFSDIGCYTLGALPPFTAIDTCIDMGASITMAKGAADAGVFPAISVIGDSTFAHSGMTGLLDCVNAKSPITIIISDNQTTAMTGGQDSAATTRIENICKGIGVEEEHLHVITPLPKNREQTIATLRKEIAYQGLSVIIPRRECIQTLKRKKKS
ncbi:MAG: indolepyruvate ferredoxin oxidoreductase [Tannerellaceae bacterium]|jgi:indolepyruvate ferredoxin oxidoreductase alpha subunit|nr:indolepyruvate ferredoxin oxidoreductase [Tannerellaceae bacterium]